VGTAGGAVALLAVSDGRLLQRWLAHEDGAVGAMAFGGDGGAAWLLTSSAARMGTVSQWRTDDGELLRDVSLSGPVAGLRPVPALGRAMVAFAHDGTLASFPLEDAKPRPRQLDVVAPAALCLSGDGRRLLSINLTSAANGRQASITLHSISHAAPPRCLPLPPNVTLLSPPPAAMSFDGSLAAVTIGTRLVVWDDTGAVQVGGGGRRLAASTLSPLSASVAQPGQQTTARVIEAGRWLSALRLSADGSLACTGTATGDVLLWDVAGGHALALEHHKETVQSLDLAADGMLTVSLGRSGVGLAVWENCEAALLHELPLQPMAGESPGARVCLTAEGSLAAVGHTDGTISLWQPRRGALLRVITPHFAADLAPAPPDVLVLSRYGRFVLAGDTRVGLLRIYDAVTAEICSTVPVTNGELVAADLVRPPSTTSNRRAARRAARAAAHAAAQAAARSVGSRASSAIASAVASAVASAAASARNSLVPLARNSLVPAVRIVCEDETDDEYAEDSRRASAWSAATEDTADELPEEDSGASDDEDFGSVDFSAAAAASRERVRRRPTTLLIAVADGSGLRVVRECVGGVTETGRDATSARAGASRRSSGWGEAMLLPRRDAHAETASDAGSDTSAMVGPPSGVLAPQGANAPSQATVKAHAGGQSEPREQPEPAAEAFSLQRRTSLGRGLCAKATLL
jgi:WD40 repeat protein